jgi:Undecaprenyl-phosphate galactose phosphotransferase WbaP
MRRETNDLEESESLIWRAVHPRKSSMRRRTKLWLPVGDSIGLLLSWVLSFGLLWAVEDQEWRSGIVVWWGEFGASRVGIFCGLLLLMTALFGIRGHYSRRRPSADEILDILKVCLVIAIVDVLFAYLSKSYASRSWFVASWVLVFLMVPVARTFTKWQLMRAGSWQLPTLIVGGGNNAKEAAKALSSERLMGFEVVAFMMPPDEERTGTTITVAGVEIPVVSFSDGFDTLQQRFAFLKIVVALDADDLLHHSSLIQQLSARDTDISIIPPLRGLPLYGMELTHFFSHEVLMLSLRNNLARPVHQLVKRIFDVVGATSLLILLAPFFAFMTFKIRQSGADAIFGHARIGRYGKSFYCLKFRTMVPDAAKVLDELLETDPGVKEQWERDFKLREDPRVTPIGAFLRGTSLDELPQLWNVLKGEMSLVGPRPIIEEELQRYGEQAPYYLEARPGITGLWQISGRNDTGYEHRVALDSWYVRNWSLWYDLVILVRTARVVLERKGAY